MLQTLLLLVEGLTFFLFRASGRSLAVLGVQGKGEGGVGIDLD